MITPYVPKRDIKPYRPVVLDIETAPDGRVLTVACGIDGDVRLFDSWSDWWEWYRSKLTKRSPRKLWRLYAHYGASFDWVSLIQWAVDNDLATKLQFIYSDSFAIGANIRLGDQTLKLRDSYRLLPASLDALSKSFNVPYKKIKLTALPHVIKETDPALYEQYVRNDVLALQEVLYRFWTMLYERVGSLDELPMTAPALSMKMWRKTLKAPVMTVWNKEVKELSRRAYTGGRTQCFRRGVVQDVRIYDANSMYPSVMVSGEYPTSYQGGWVTEYTGEHGIYELSYKQTNRNTYPVLRDEASDEFLYEGSGVYTKPEIDELLRIGGEIHVKRGWVFIHSGNLFEDYVNYWWEVRAAAKEQGNEALAFVCKLLLNSLYGKFGQRETSWEMRLLKREEQKKLLAKGENIRIKGDFTFVEVDVHSEYTFVAVAAYVTAYARISLFRQMDAARQRGYNVWYCDTDSVHIVGDLPSGKGLGEWKQEDRGEYAYVGKKFYASANGKIRVKGVPAGYLSYDDFVRMALDDSVAMTVTFEALPSWREALIERIAVGTSVIRSRTVKPLPLQVEQPVWNEVNHGTDESVT